MIKKYCFVVIMMLNYSIAAMEHTQNPGWLVRSVGIIGKIFKENEEQKKDDSSATYEVRISKHDETDKKSSDILAAKVTAEIESKIVLSCVGVRKNVTHMTIDVALGGAAVAQETLDKFSDQGKRNLGKGVIPKVVESADVAEDTLWLRFTVAQTRLNDPFRIKKQDSGKKRLNKFASKL